MMTIPARPVTTTPSILGERIPEQQLGQAAINNGKFIEEFLTENSSLIPPCASLSSAFWAWPHSHTHSSNSHTMAPHPAAFLAAINQLHFRGADFILGMFLT